MRQSIARSITAAGVGIIVSLASCITPAGQRKLIDTVNEAQLSAAQTYDTAKVLQASAQTSCGATLRQRAMPMPTPETAKATCAAVGVPLPYDPVKLQNAAGPINSLYDAVRYANTQRTSASGDTPAAVLGGLAGAFEAVIADLAGAGVAVPKGISDAVATVKAATGGPK